MDDDDQLIKLIAASELQTLKFDPTEWSNARSHRIVMAALVEAVYKMEKDRISDTEKDRRQYWDTFGFTLHRKIYANSGSIIAAVFRHNLKNGPMPKSVVAMRGTIMKPIGDFLADIQIALQCLHANSRFNILKSEVEEEVGLYKEAGVYLTGHSKGAALALLVGRYFAEGGVFLDCHLFNPPNLMVPSTISQPKSSFVRSLLYNVVHNVAAKGLAHILLDDEERQALTARYNKLTPWFPIMYLNSQDPICAGYLRYFDAQTLVAGIIDNSLLLKYGFTSTPHSIRSMIFNNLLDMKDCRPDHLIPSAHLIVNTTKKITTPLLDDLEKALKCFKNAHTLDQWLDLGQLNLVSERISASTSSIGHKCIGDS